MSASRYVLNGAFRGQRITGQQRYATELSARLPASEVVAPAWIRKRSILAWLWVQFIPFLMPGRTLLMTFTSRGPFAFRRQVLTVHDLFVLNHPEWYSKRYVLTHAPMLRWQMRTARAIVTVSEPVAQQVRELVGAEVPVAVVPNAPAEVFGAVEHRAARADVESAWGLRPGSFVLSVASRDPRKNGDTLLAAYASLPESWRSEHPLVLVGGAHGAFASGTGAAAPLVGVHDLGYVTDEQLAALYATAGLVVFLSLDEGFGLPAVEAAAAGASLLVSDIPVLRWVCGDGAEFVPPRDVSSVAERLVELVDRGRPTDPTGTRFDWDESAAVLDSFLGSLAR